MFNFVTSSTAKAKRSLGPLSLWVVVSAIVGIGSASTALAESSPPSDLLCYLQTENGQLVNLSRFCGSSENQARELSPTDQQFLKVYKGFLSKRSQSLPSVAAALSQVQQSPQTVVARAKRICTDVRSGALSQDQLPQTAVDSDLMNTMAFEYYCPDLDD